MHLIGLKTPKMFVREGSAVGGKEKGGKLHKKNEEKGLINSTNAQFIPLDGHKSIIF